jgi:hydrogenase maturation protein HypF
MFLDNDRPIVSRYDDSVVRVIGDQMMLVRRARGFAPAPLPFPHHPKREGASARAATLLAVGPEQKSTFALVRDGEAFVSQHLGDLESASALEAWHTTLAHYQRLFDLQPTRIACDRHPEYLSTKWARAQSEPRIEVQHHHAHIASVLAEHATQRAIGIAFDGAGFGEDGSLWGGEVLIASRADYERFAYLRPVPLPGGAAAVRHPEHMAWSYLFSLGLSEHSIARLFAKRLGSERRGVLEKMIASGLNSPLTSSMGRLFDAVSALLGLCDTPSYEGQPAVELEAALYGLASSEITASAAPYRFALDLPRIDPSPVLSALLDDRAADISVARISLRFHQSVVALILEVCEAARKASGLTTVALSGGVFMNRFLVTRVLPALRTAGFLPLMNSLLPANDGCIAYGQAAVADALLAQRGAEGIELSHDF